MKTFDRVYDFIILLCIVASYLTLVLFLGAAVARFCDWAWGYALLGRAFVTSVVVFGVLYVVTLALTLLAPDR